MFAAVAQQKSKTGRDGNRQQFEARVGERRRCEVEFVFKHCYEPRNVIKRTIKYCQQSQRSNRFKTFAHTVLAYAYSQRR
jgi:hypothetical protein